MRRLFAVLFAVLATASTARAVGVRGPSAVLPAAGIMASSNVSLALTIPDTGGVGGRFVRDGATTWYFMTGYSGLRIYDATNAELPVLTGVLPVPMWENEDVDVSASRKLVLLSVDDMGQGGGLYVVSWATPRVPELLAFLEYPPGAGHIANCIADCARYAYVTGAADGVLHIVDLQDPASPRVLPNVITKAQNPAGRGNGAFRNGVVHDVNSESATRVWTTGSGGTTMLDVTDPLNPVKKYEIPASVNGQHNQFIHHNSIRLDASTVLVTEEDWLQPQCGDLDDGEQGEFQTWAIPATATGNLAFRDSWTTELGTYVQDGAAVTVTCSSHWFTVNDNKVVAVGWYDQGVRFLDVSDPSNIRQVGYWIRPSAGLGASAGLYHPVRDDVVYVPDYERGLDVLKIAGGGANAQTVVAPIRKEWLQPGIQFRAEPHPVFGWACQRPAA
ncbi:MAG: LVIVD repeat-containing protein [Actinomycetota bacterium]